MHGDWEQGCRDIHFRECGPVRCNVQNVRVSLQASARSLSSILIWSSGTTETMKGLLPPKSIRSARIGNSFATAVLGENRLRRLRREPIEWCKKYERCQATCWCSRVDIFCECWVRAGLDSNRWMGSASSSAPPA